MTIRDTGTDWKPLNVEYLDHMGSDLSVVNAARVSFHKESSFDENNRLPIRDDKLIHYLAEHKHWSPFAHATIQFRITAPIFVARQLVKHQVGLVWNEVSRRYVDDKPQYFVPDAWRLRPEDGIKQGSSEKTIDVNSVLVGYYRQREDNPDDPTEWVTSYEDYLDMCTDYYERLLANGVAPEMARMVLPQSMLTQWWWTGSLYAWARVCRERLAPHAQKETGIIAQQIAKTCNELFPVSWDALGISVQKEH